MNEIRVFCADDHHIIISGLKITFSEYNENADREKIVLAGSAETAEELLSNANRDDIDVFVVDLGFDSTRGTISIIKRMLDINPSIKMVIFSMRENIHTVIACYRSGAKSFVSKSNNSEVLMDAIIAASEDKEYYIDGVLDEIGRALLHDPLSELDERSSKLFIMLAQDIEIKEIEKQLGISEKTINNIVSSKIKPVLGVNRRHFKKIAVRMGLLEEDIE